MVDALVVQEILGDVHFLKLADDKTDSAEFTRLLEEHVKGYSQKKRVSDGLKELVKKIEEAENRINIARNVGKFKAPEPEDARLTSLASSFELKEKIQLANTQLEAMLTEGQITYFEKPHVLENLRSRLAKAKEAGKAKLEEKLDKFASAVARANAFTLSVGNLKEFHKLEKELTAIAGLEKLSAKALTLAVRDRIENKAVVQGDFDTLVDSSRMWFETATEFKPRLYEAMRVYAAGEEERKKKEEEEAFEQRLQAEQDAIEAKRLEVEAKRMAAEKELDDKLKAKRIEAAAKPVKEIPKKQIKEKKVIAKVDLQSMFQEEREVDYEEVNAAELQAELEAEAKKREFARAYAELAEASKEAEAAKKSRAVAETKEAKAAREAKLAKVEKLKAEAKTAPKAAEPAVPLKPTKTAEQKAAEDDQKFKALEEKLAAKRLEAAAAPKKEVKEPPKKEKKVATKMSLLDFYSEDLVLDKLAAQQAEEKILREAREKEAAILAAEEEAAWAADEAAWAEQETTGTAAPSLTVKTAAPSVSVAPKPTPSPDAKVAPKPKRKPPVEMENKWGAPVVPAGAVFEGEGDLDVAGPSLAESMPTLGDALTAPKKKTPPPMPAKKQKKKWGKVDAGLIGFDDSNPNVYEN